MAGRPPITTDEGVFVSNLRRKDLNRVGSGAIVYDRSGQVKEMSDEGFKPAELYAIKEREAGVRARDVDPVTPADVTRAASRGKAKINIPANGARPAGKAAPLAEIVVVHEGTKRFLAHPDKIVVPLRSKMGDTIVRAKTRADRTEQSLRQVLSNDHMQRTVEHVEEEDVFLIDETVKIEVDT